MPKFIVPVEMSPGAARGGIGFFRPGSSMEWPDVCTERAIAAGMEEKPNKYLIPLDEAGYELLKSYWPDEDIRRPEGMPEPKPNPAFETQTIKEAVAEHNLADQVVEEKKAPAKKSGRGKRAADQ
jgi:hypothetical protein